MGLPVGLWNKQSHQSAPSIHMQGSIKHRIDSAMDLGIKQGFVKGLLMGNMGIIYAIWAFQAWVGSVLVTERGEQGGVVFVSGLCVMMGGL